MILAAVTLIPSMYHVIDQNVSQADLDACHANLDSVAAKLGTDGISTAVEVSEDALREAEKVVTLAEGYHAECIALITHGRGGLSRLLLGSVAAKIIHLAPIPVLSLGLVHLTTGNPFQ